MPLQPGQTVAHYTVRQKIGEGGMGEVYRALDEKLGRDVAIKMLPAEVARDPDRLARFKREAQVLASLNHPNIASIYGLEDEGRTPILVLELVGGEDLAARLQHGPVPLEDALGIAQQIAEGLEEAHERGIVHRDLKPANIKLTPDGKVKILDFGLAKAFDPSSGGTGDPSMSPTLTAAATRPGVILGTAAYMSPEQARGGTADKRADIWAFGCVLLEMLSGARAFAGDTISDTLANILKSDPDLEVLPAGNRPALRRLLRRCLEKDRGRRLRDIGEARIALEAIRSGTPIEEPADDARPPGPVSRWRTRPLLAAVVLTAAVTAGVTFALRPGPPAARVQKYEFSWPGNLLDENHYPMLSPDGSRIAFATPAGLRVRKLDELDTRLLAGTEMASHPFWSPDGTTIGFTRGGGLWTIPVEGGQANSIIMGIGDISEVGNAIWKEDGRILFSSGNAGIREVSSRGGDARTVLEPDPKEVQDIHHLYPLPGGRGILYVAHRMAGTFDNIRVHARGASNTLLQIDNHEIRTPVYSPTGHILYRRLGGNSGLWAVPFSLKRLEITGEPFLVARDGGMPSVAADGSLLYVWKEQSAPSQLVWIDREGIEVGNLGPPMTAIREPRISPDGRLVALMGQESEMWDIWILDVERGIRSRLTFTPAMDWNPAWSADSRQVFFWDGGTQAITIKPADGSSAARRVVQEEFPDSGLPSPSRDGKTLLFWVRNPQSKGDLYTMSLEGGSAPEPWLQSPFMEDEPALSPDARYVSYSSDESGRKEIYLTRFPGGDGRWQVSVEGGGYSCWDPRGGRLYYLQGRDMMEVEISSGSAPDLGSPRRLFSLPWITPENWWNNRFSLSPDGSRFLFSKSLEAEGEEPRLVLVRNWVREFGPPE